jgi:hypothetical protein
MENKPINVLLIIYTGGIIMSDSILFNAYRYFIKIYEDKYHVYHYIDPYPVDKKHLLIYHFLEGLKLGVKYPFTYFNKKHLLYYISL